ncbi:MAG: hypothetical protein M9928_21730 [Anaerolineae bacterium]|nr:hypothetical protein [Anaerolineae bacterium]MCO5195443.1 hypothetical protein [Anaerolineae bacterium]MCO5199999.1 hypothetical protein [Anaerolineae bacterium]MCO5207637.1 hypothetical protein [Anaerolineae bacterium]
MGWYAISDFKDYRTITNDDDNVVIAAIAEAAEGWLNREAGTVIVTDATSTRYIDATGLHIEGRTLWLSHVGDCAEITEITNGDGATVDSADYIMTPRAVSWSDPTIRKVTLKASSGLVWTYDDDPEQAIAVEGYWSVYKKDSVPAEILGLMRELVNFGYTKRDSQVFDTVAIPEAGVVTIPDGFPRSAGRIVKTLRNRNLI